MFLQSINREKEGITNTPVHELELIRPEMINVRTTRTQCLFLLKLGMVTELYLNIIYTFTHLC